MRSATDFGFYTRHLRRCYVFSVVAFALSLELSAQQDVTQPAELPGYTVIAQRYPGKATDSPYSYEILGRDELESLPQRRLDDALRTIPGFSLFRRSSSRVAHPTTQGVSLRNIGPNGAGRTLVLLDGVPMNDPFGGWVYWNRLPITRIQSIEIQRGGGAGAWGNSALGGTIRLFSDLSSGSDVFFEATGGNRGTAEAAVRAQSSHSWGDAFVTAAIFSTDGYPVVRGDQRGIVDVNAFSEAEIVEGGVRIAFGEDRTFFARFSYFNEDRGNGTLLAVNATRAHDMSAGLRQGIFGGQGSLEAMVYYQNRDFSSFFPSVAADRSSERPALDQFDVPATSWGGNVVAGLAMADQHRLLVGADARRVRGETNERFFFNGTTFNFERQAGGTQTLLGFFTEYVYIPKDALSINLSFRADYWNSDNGFRKRTDLNTDEIVRDEQFPAVSKWVGNARVGFAYEVSEKFRLRSHFTTGFRAPTLNELYRPFRVRSDITESNPELEPERLYGGEIGLEWLTSDGFGINLAYFYNRLNSAVANVTLAPGPGVVAPCGFVPGGGSCRQRRNLESVRVQGLEVDGNLVVGEHWRLKGRYLYSDARISNSDSDPRLEGNRLAQTPKHAVTLTAIWQATKTWRNTFQMRYVGRQFENDTNTLELDSLVVLDWASSFLIDDGLEVFVSIENLTNTEFEIGLASNGIVSIGAPRLISGGLRWRR